MASASRERTGAKVGRVSDADGRLLGLQPPPYLAGRGPVETGLRPSTTWVCTNLPYMARSSPRMLGLAQNRGVGRRVNHVCLYQPPLSGRPRPSGDRPAPVNHVGLYQPPLSGTPKPQNVGVGTESGGCTVRQPREPVPISPIWAGGATKRPWASSGTKRSSAVDVSPGLVPRTSGRRRPCTQAPATIYLPHKIGLAPLLHRPRTRQYAGIPWRIPVQRCTSLSRGASPPPSERASRPHLWASF